ncbi:MAG: alpha-2-macroglobulin family protein, partial [Chitinophagales bacterium]
EKQLVFKKEINTGTLTSIDLPPEGLPAGDYEVDASCEEDGKMIGEASVNFSVVDSVENILPNSSSPFYLLPVNLVSPGDRITFYSGSPEKDFYAIYHLVYYSAKKRTTVGYFYGNQKCNEGINKWMFTIPNAVKDEIKFTQIYVLNNKVYIHEERIFVNSPKSDNPEITIEQYRKKLTPGAKETFSVSIKTRNENVAAELLTGMYDASLDKLQEHHWTIPRDENYSYLNTRWQRSINSFVNNNSEDTYRDKGFFIHNISVSKPLWWMNPLKYKYNDLLNDLGNFDNPGSGSLLQGRVAGLNILDANGLNEVVVVGYGVQRKQYLTGSVSSIMLRGLKSLSAYSQPLIILDGVPFKGDLSQIDPKILADMLVLKGADASAIYGSIASAGVLILSTKGKIILPASTEDVPIPSRKNFNETAFFFPQVHADKNGYYSFTFTMPESVTEWNWKMFAHTKNAQFAYVERKLNTQLPLMVQPNMPRFLYQGDRVILQSRITNLDSTAAFGKIFCKIEDVVTGEDITSMMVANSQNNFSVAERSNISSAFEITIPKAQLNPVKVIITVRSQNFTDGEEHVVPILTPKILVRENTAFSFSNNTDTTIKPINLSADEELYGIGLSILPKPQSALINALPYLANYSFDCAEQTFNKLFTLATAFKLMRTDSEAQKVFNLSRQIIEKEPASKDQLPDELSEEVTPWLNLSNKTAIQQKQLFQILDTSNSGTKIKEHLDKLYKLQNSDGGLTWFSGGKSDPYISNYVLAGFGKLQKENLEIPEKLFTNNYADFLAKLIGHSDDRFNTEKETRVMSGNSLYYIYARSFWKDNYPLNDTSIQQIQNSLNGEWEKFDKYGLHNQAILIICTLRYFDKTDSAFQKAIQSLNSIEQEAIMDEINGIRWKDLADADDLSNTAEETLSLIVEAFSEADIQPEVFPGIIKWLLTAKSEDHWSSTKATSAVIGMLTKENQTATGITQTINSKINNENLSVTDNMLAGNTYLFVKTNKSLPVGVKKLSSVPAAGNLIWYYFTESNDLSKANREVSLKKEIQRYNSIEGKWEAISENSLLKIGEKIKVVLEITSSKALKYVYIDDKRAAAFEPKEIHSGYDYENGLGYYLSVRDASMQFFSEFIPSGKSVISQELIVAQEGNFTNGPASLQCMYRPEINAFSNSIKVQTTK